MKIRNHVVITIVITVIILLIARQQSVNNYLRQLSDDVMGFPGEVYSFNNQTSKPLRNYILTWGYGPRLDPITNEPSFHYGVDLVASEGAPVMAVKDGIIKVMDYQENGYGNFVLIEHLDKTTTIYGHLRGFGNITIDQEVGAGSVIGALGNTGRSTGPHLHFELRIESGERVDPKALI